MAAESGVKGVSLEMTGHLVLILTSEGRAGSVLGACLCAECHKMEKEKMEIRFD